MEEDALWWREVWKIRLGSFQGFFHLQSDPVLFSGVEDLSRSAEAMGLPGCESTFAFLHGYGQVENQTSEKKRVQIRWTGWKWDSESGDCPPQHAPSILDSFCTWSFAHAVSGRWVSIPPASLWSPTHRPTPTQLVIGLFSFFSLCLCPTSLFIILQSGCYHPFLASLQQKGKHSLVVQMVKNLP